MENSVNTASYIAPELEKNVNMNGIAPSESEEIKLSYSPYFLQIAEIKERAKKINFENPNEDDREIARKLRLATVKIRTACEEVKNERKRLHSLKANIEQAAYNLIASGCKLEEEIFSRVEKAQEIKAKAEKEALKAKRLELLAPYDFNPGQVKIEDFPEQAFETLLESLRQKADEARKAAAAAEAEKIQKEVRDKLLSERKEALTNIGAKVIGERIKIEFKEDSVEVKISDLPLMSEDFFDKALKDFQELSDKKTEYEKTVEAENERMKKESEDREKKQDRYNQRIERLSRIGAQTIETGMKIADITRDETLFISFDEILNSEENFEAREKQFASANYNNQMQLEIAKAEGEKQEALKQKAAEAKEKRYNERLVMLTDTGARIAPDRIFLASINKEGFVNSISVEDAKNMDDSKFSRELLRFQQTAEENNRQLDLEKEAAKAETEAREKAEKELAERKAEKEKQDKEAESARLKELEAQRKAALAPDKEKLLTFAKQLEELPRPVLKSNEASNVMIQIEVLIGKTVAYLKEKSDQI